MSTQGPRMRRLLPIGRPGAVGPGPALQLTSSSSSRRRLLLPRRLLASTTLAAASSLKRARPGMGLPQDQEQLRQMGSSSTAAEGGPPNTNAGEALTGFDLQVLGSASKMPTVHSSCPCIGLRVGPTQLLFDVGEGTQRQFMRSILNPCRVQGIFITHMHGDHIFGLPGMLLSFLSLINSSQDGAAAAGAEAGGGAGAGRTHTLRVFGPEGLYNYVAMTLRLCEARVGPNLSDGKAPIVVHELMGAGERRAPFVKRDPDFASPGIEWRPIERDPDGFWTIPPIPPPTRPAHTHPHPHSHHEKQFRFTVRAGPLRHSVATFGYTVEEMPKRGKLDAAKARALGLPPGPLYKQLVRGEDVTLPGGRGVVRARDVLGPPQRGRKVTVLGDTCDASAMAPLAMDSDVLVHEATLEDGLAELAALRGHSTPSMAARFARDVRARRLLLTHFSNRYSSSSHAEAEAEAEGEEGGGMRAPPDVARLVRQAAAVLGDERRVLAAHDFLQVNVPWQGFELVGALPSSSGEDNAAAAAATGTGVGPQGQGLWWRGAGGAVASS